jgi:predicted ATPase
LSLRRLGRDESDELIRGIIIGNAPTFSTEIVDENIERTDGVPLFVEELTKAVLEAAISGAGLSAVPAASPAVPPTLHASLMARLDRLGSATKDVAQIGAAIGREFSYELLTTVAQRDEAELRDVLSRLIDAGACVRTWRAPAGEFPLQTRSGAKGRLGDAATRAAPGSARADR